MSKCNQKEVLELDVYDDLLEKKCLCKIAKPFFANNLTPLGFMQY